MEDNYIHPNFKPTDKDKYLRVVNSIRAMCCNLDREEFIIVDKEVYQVLEDAVHPSMKGKGHQCYGVEIRTA